MIQRQADRLSKDGAAKAVEPTQIQLSKRWQDIASKFAQFRRLNYAQIVSCSWKTFMFANTTTNKTLLTLRIPNDVSEIENLASDSNLFYLQYNIVFILYDFSLVKALKIKQEVVQSTIY